MCLAVIVFVLLVGITVSDISETIVQQDIRKAFSGITNRTDVMAKMYDEEMLCRTNDPALIFELPSNSEHAEGGSGGVSRLWMPRSMFMPPIFPNITKLSGRSSQHVPPSNLYAAAAENSEWSDFGLDGWTGAIASEPGDALEAVTQNQPDEINYPATDIAKDFNAGGEIQGFVQDLTTSDEPKRNSNTSEVGHKREISDNVYIARVNDPFGYSTKWQQKRKLPPAHNDTIAGDRSKRDVIELYSMIKCSTGCNPLGYKNYGCYCGFSGAGVPVDGIDHCCRLHDKCYENTNCISYLEYFVPYVWKCYSGKPLCAIDHGEWGGPTSCAALLCYCDARLSRCLRQYDCPTRHRYRPPVCRTSLARRLQNLLFNG